MNIAHLKYFLTLVEYKNYSKAARQSYISQPALSKAIKNLENELEIELFKKVGKENHLTTQGKIFYGYVKSSIDILDKGLNQLKLLSKENLNNIKISSVYSCSTQCVPWSIIEFRKNFPDVTFDCKENSSSTIIEDVINSQIHLGLISDYSNLKGCKNIEMVKLFDYEVFLAVPKNHRLAKVKYVKYKDIIDEPFISYTDNTALYKLLESELKLYNLPYPQNIVAKCNSESAIISSVEKGLGIGFVSATTFNKNSNTTLLSFENIFLKFPIYMIWRNDIVLPVSVTSYKDHIMRAHHLEIITKS